MEDCHDDFQMELIELQADMETKRKYSENSLVDFYKLYFMCVKCISICPIMQKECLLPLVTHSAVNNFSPTSTSSKANVEVS